MLELIINLNNALNGFIWGIPAMTCILGVGLYLAIRTRFLPIRKFGYAMKNTFGKMFDKNRRFCYAISKEKLCGNTSIFYWI